MKAIADPEKMKVWREKATRIEERWSPEMPNMRWFVTLRPDASHNMIPEDQRPKKQVMVVQQRIEIRFYMGGTSVRVGEEWRDIPVVVDMPQFNGDLAPLPDHHKTRFESANPSEKEIAADSHRTMGPSGIAQS